MNIFILCIEHKYGRNVTAHTTEEGARNELYNYVYNETSGYKRDSIPGDHNAAIKQYFEDNDKEGFFLEMTELQTY